MDKSRLERLLVLQRMEATEAEVYRRLAMMQQDPVNKSILEGIALEEERHEAVISEMTGQVVTPNKFQIMKQMVLARIFGFTFSIMMMEATENDVASEYRDLGLIEIAEEEEVHEENMISMLDEERLRYSGSIVLGMSDALIELTGALAGLTFALKDLDLVALAGLVTGIAAAFSMGASEYLSSRAEKREVSAAKSAFFTWISYLITVILLVSPYLIIDPGNLGIFGLESHEAALASTFIIGLVIVGIFNFYTSIVERVSFTSRFMEMVGILGAVSLMSYAIGIVLGSALGVS